MFSSLFYNKENEKQKSIKWLIWKGREIPLDKCLQDWSFYNSVLLTFVALTVDRSLEKGTPINKQQQGYIPKILDIHTKNSCRKDNSRAWDKAWCPLKACDRYEVSFVNTGFMIKEIRLNEFDIFISYFFDILHLYYPIYFFLHQNTDWPILMLVNVDTSMGYRSHWNLPVCNNLPSGLKKVFHNFVYTKDLQ